MLPSINSLINDPPLEVTKKYYSKESGNELQVPLQPQQQQQAQPQQLQQQQQQQQQSSSYSDPYSYTHHGHHYYPQETQQTATFASEQPHYQQAPQPQQYHQPQSRSQSQSQSQSHQQHRQQIHHPSTISTSLPLRSSPYGGISSGGISSGGLQLLPGYPTHHNRSHSLTQSMALYSNQSSNSGGTGNFDSYGNNNNGCLGDASSSGGYFSNGPLLYPQLQPQHSNKLRSASSASANSNTITTAPIVLSPPSSTLINTSRNAHDGLSSREYYGPGLGLSSSNTELQNNKYETAEMKERRLQKEKEKRDQITNGITRLQKMVPKLNQQQLKKGKVGNDLRTSGSLKSKGRGLENSRKSKRSAGNNSKDTDANAIPKRTSKAAILSSSAQYIKDLKKEIEELKLKINQYEERGKKLSSSQIRGHLKDIESYRGKLDEYEKYKQEHTNTTPEHISNKKPDFSFIKSEYNPQTTLPNRKTAIASVGAAHLRMSSPLPFSSAYNESSFQPPPSTHSQPSQPPKSLQISHSQPKHHQKLPPTLPPILPPQQRNSSSTMYHINSTIAENSSVPSSSSQNSYTHNYSGYYPSPPSASPATAANMHSNGSQQNPAQQLSRQRHQQQQERLQQQYYASSENLGNPLLRRPSGLIQPNGQLGSTNTPAQGYYGYYHDNNDESAEKKGTTSLSQYKI